MRASSSKLIISTFLVAHCFHGMGQCEYVDQPDPPSMGTLYESRHGRFMTTNGVVRILIVLAEVKYLSPGVDPTPNGGTPGWPYRMSAWTTRA